MGRPDILTRIVLRSDRLVDAGLRAVRGAFDGFWLGVLASRRLAALDAAYYDRQRMYTDEAYNRRGLFEWEDHAVSTYFPAGCRVTVVGAGGGREVLALLAAGFDALGFEPNPVLAEFGARLTSSDGYGERVKPVRREGWPEAVPQADAVVIGWGAYMLIPGRSARVGYLRGARESLPERGRMLLSFFPRRGTDIRFRVSSRVGSTIRAIRHRQPVEVGDALVPNYVHYFTEEQISAELADAGLRPLEISLEDYGWAVAEVVPTT